jgi:predicted nucleotide-binding protein
MKSVFDVLSMDTDKLFALAEKLIAVEKRLEGVKSLDLLDEVLKQVAKSWSGSWIGYHSRVYYGELEEPPAGAHFSKEWGLYETISGMGSVGDWREYKNQDVIDWIWEEAGNPDISDLRDGSKRAMTLFEESKAEVQSFLSFSLTEYPSDKFLNELSERIDKIKTFRDSDFIDYWKPKGSFISRDMLAAQAGIQTPPHYSVLAQAFSIRHAFSQCGELAKIVKTVSSHVENLTKKAVKKDRIGTNIFIGHGRSKIWKDLKDFVQDRLRLPWDEFNRVPVAGITTIARLSEMLDRSAFAFLIMTAEDEQVDGKLHARMNVVHEAGLFQGRLGFHRAIILLEEGCETFSNVEGLGQIRFPKGDITKSFEEIRMVLEREEILSD